MPLWFQIALLPHGWKEGVRLTLSGGRIQHVETAVAPAGNDERHAIGLPGLCNVHSHGFQRGMAGLAEVRGPEGDNFWTWREVMYRFLERLGPEEVEAITALAYMEMLKTGFTRVAEFHYLHRSPSGRAYENPAELSERIVAAATTTYIGLTLLPVFYAHSNFGGLPPTDGQRRFINSVEQFSEIVEAARGMTSALPGANIGVAPHSLRAVTPEELAPIVSLAGNEPVHIHVSEQTKEVDDCVTWSGARPVEWLLDHAEINKQWCLIHATHLVDAEVTRVAGSGAAVGACPITEANLGDGVFPAANYLVCHGRLGIGTDSNVLIDAAAELRGLEYAQRLTSRSRNALAAREGQSTGRQLFEYALAGGAQASGQEQFGLREGASADLFSLNADDPVFVERKDDAILDSWIFGGGKVDCAWSHGRRVVEHGHHIAEDEIVRRYRRALKSVLE